MDSKIHYIYKITNRVSNREYIGLTNNVKLRWNSHICFSKTRVTPLYCSMRKYGIEFFDMEILCICPNREYANNVEIELIKAKDNLYNLAKGGEGGYVVPDDKREDWILKLKKARKGRKPALGMKHTEENKKLFSEVSRKYWATQKTYDPNEVVKYKCAEAKRVLVISKTHYYRLVNKWHEDNPQ